MNEVTLAANTLLWEAGRPVTHSYFPVSGYISIVLPLVDGQTIEVASVGREGAAGTRLDRDEGRFATAGLVTIGGRFVKIVADVLRAAAEDDREISLLLRLCRDWIFIQAQQIAACNTVHAADRRFCRWLFECSRRVQSDMIFATQEQIAGLLGIRRTTVTLLAQGLHTRGLIDYSRGKISVIDAEGLRESACGCCDSLAPRHWPSKRLTPAES